jgi:uncharacterized membrane protein
MDESLVILLGLAVLALFVVTVIVLPILVAVQGRRIARLRARLERLERQQGMAGPRQEIAAVAPQPSAATEPVIEIVPADEPAEPVVAGGPFGPPPPWPVDAAGWPPAPAESWETWIGRRGLGWVAVVLMLLATAFFLKQVFENRWIGELGRVALGVAAGLLLCGVGFRYYRRDWRRFSQMLTAGGVVLLYLSAFGAFGYYHLLPRQPASLFLVVLIVEAAALAVLYEAPAIALMAVIGGLLTPLLLAGDRDQYRSLFLYLIALNAGVAGLSIVRPWRVIGLASFLGSQGLFWAWYDQHYHPEKLAAAIGFQAALLGLYLGASLVVHVVRRRKATVEDLVRMLLVAGLSFAAAYTLLDEDYRLWMGTLAIGMAVVYASFAWIALRRAGDDGRLVLTSVAVAIGFVATAIPIQAQAVWISLGWAILGLALWWFGLKARLAATRALGAALLVLAAGRLVIFNTPSLDRPPFVPLWNTYGLPALAVTACILTVAALGWRNRREKGDRHLLCEAPEGPFRQKVPVPLFPTSLDRLAMAVAGLGGVALVWLVLSLESYQYFTARAAQRESEMSQRDQRVSDASGRPIGEVAGEQADQLRRLGQTALSMVWAGYGVVVLSVGFWLRSSGLRWAALLVLGATLGKVVLVDMSGLPGFYRVATLFAAAVVMAMAAWAYQKWQVSQRETPEVERP